MRTLLVIALVLTLISLYFILKPESMTCVENSPVILEGIIGQGDSLMTIISGKVLKEGDIIKGYRIIKIEKDNGVILSSENKQFKLAFDGLFRLCGIKYKIKSWFKEKIFCWLKKQQSS